LSHRVARLAELPVDLGMGLIRGGQQLWDLNSRPEQAWCCPGLGMEIISRYQKSINPPVNKILADKEKRWNRKRQKFPHRWLADIQSRFIAGKYDQADISGGFQPVWRWLVALESVNRIVSLDEKNLHAVTIFFDFEYFYGRTLFAAFRDCQIIKLSFDSF
jgi:hypothetical protein